MLSINVLLLLLGGMATVVGEAPRVGARPWCSGLTAAAARKTRRTQARLACEGKLGAALARVEELEAALLEERLLWLPGPERSDVEQGWQDEVRERTCHVVPAIKARVLGEPLPRRLRILRNLATHRLTTPMAAMAKLSVRKLTALQRGARGLAASFMDVVLSGAQHHEGHEPQDGHEDVGHGDLHDAPHHGQEALHVHDGAAHDFNREISGQPPAGHHDFKRAIGGQPPAGHHDFKREISGQPPIGFAPWGPWGQ